MAGAAGGMAVGAVTGPVGAALGAAAGAVAGGYAGKAVGELIDPTTEDNWLRDNFKSRPYVKGDETFETYRPAYGYGAAAESRYGDVDFDTIEEDLEKDWSGSREYQAMPWPRARDAVRDSYDRTVELRKERGRSGTCPPKM